MKKSAIKQRKKIVISLKKIIAFVILLSVLFFSTNLIVKATEETVDVVCKDYNLYQTLKERINSSYLASGNSDKANEDGTYTLKVKAEAISSITSLNLSNSSSDSRKITDLTGIESFSYLTELNLKNNNVSDVSQLLNLNNITTLDLSGNNISSLDIISKINNLEILNLSANKINDISKISGLKNLINLDLSNNSISTTSAIQQLTKLQILNLSGNTSISNIDDVLVSSLTNLNLSDTAITKIDPDGDKSYIKILDCKNLKELRLANCKITDISNLFVTEKVENTTKAVLRNIEILDLSNTGISSFSSIKLLENLKELYLKGNNISNLSGIDELQYLEYVNLDNNKINDSGLKNIRITTTSGGQTVTKSILKAKQISLKNNQISDITPLGYMSEIEFLDLSENKVQSIKPIEQFSFSKGLNLRNQSIDMAIYKKNIDENQYIILLNILQSAKDSSSKAYYANSYYTTVGVELNNGQEYQMAPYYNVIMDSSKTTNDVMQVTVHGGITDGSTINFKLSTSTSSIDTLKFEDKNLDSAIYNDLSSRASSNTYIARAPYIINITQSVVKDTKELQLSNGNIEKLEGLGNFSNLTTLNLADNNISNDTEIRKLKKLQNLNLANNKLNNNYSSIENLYELINLNLIGNNIQDLNSLSNLINNINEAHKKNSSVKTKLTDLSLSDNQITDISSLKYYTEIQRLYLASNKINNIEPLAENTKLKVLDISKNEIEKIDAVKLLNKLETINANNNLIKDISAISSLSLYTLNISNNRISDISALEGQVSLLTLDISNNKINDVSKIESLLIRNEFNVKQQKLAEAMPNEQTESVTIKLPAIFISAKNTNSKVYTSNDFELENCSLSDDLSAIIIKPNELGQKIAKIKIVGGEADGTILSVANSLKAEINYSETNKTRNDVIATISFDRNTATILNNEGKNTYTFTENGEFTFEYTDENGFEGSKTAKVDWIDKIGPKCEVTYSTSEYTQDPVTVTITSDEKLQDVDGWEFINDEKTKIQKSFSENISTTITLKDELGNSSDVKIEIKNIKQEEVLESNKYKINEDESIIENIQHNTNIQTFKNNITSNNNYKIVNKNGEDVSSSSLICTGYKLITQNGKTYDIVVLGDVTGNGQIGVSDLSIIAKVAVGLNNLDGVYKKAGDLTGDGKIEITDLSKIAKLYVGL